MREVFAAARGEPGRCAIIVADGARLTLADFDAPARVRGSTGRPPSGAHEVATSDRDSWIEGVLPLLAMLYRSTSVRMWWD